MRYIAWSLLAAYLLVVHAWPTAATPAEAVAAGAFTVLAQPSVLLLVALIAVARTYWLRPAPARTGSA